ncbi:IPT/TIG domain-containing protein [Chitinophaga pendula]|uniref:IPT/TIG domain-containing protein n=1 Tax=Chitinophaga TaxID=79328 RepID=UPI000BB02F41|nr:MULTISPECIES: IPT/TIG domain-containing protein [Chitinophaga]ASZ14144.1 hypothetical protein CK934_25940 [Chitinophaga sp. MD30]UCJ08220.1 IPT/TIG domain-containing protein [Chitinophaga pendula]
MKHYLYILLSCLLLATACKRNKQDEMNVPLAVRSFWPNSGNAGTIVTFKGTGFSRTANENEISFNGTPANVVDVNDTSLIVLAPSGGNTGEITVKVNGKQATAGLYTYQQLSIKGASPLNGPAGTNVSIRGSGFNSISSPATVYVNGITALVTSMSDSLLVVAVPIDAGSGAIKVKVEGREVNGPDFRFQKISRIKPLRGGKGTQVKISGQGFDAAVATNFIDFNGKPGRVISATETELVVATPDEVATGPLSVTINGQRTVGPIFTVIPPPVLTAVTPLSSPVGATVTLTGKNFSPETDENDILFNGIKATVKSASDNQLTVLVPAGAGSANMHINVNGQTTEGPLFKEQQLGVISLLPDNGLEGTEVKISGLGFSTTPANNIVTFNGVAVTVLNATETTLTVKAPAGVTTGTLDVKVGNLSATGPLFRRAGVMTLAGGTSGTSFNDPAGLVVDAQGYLYTGDNNQIKKVSPTGIITHFAGSLAGNKGNLDGKGAAALFNNPRSLVMDAQENIYLIDGDFQRTFVRKVTKDGSVVTIYDVAGSMPAGLAVSASGRIYVTKLYQGIFRLEDNRSLTRLGNGVHTIEYPMAIDGAGNIYYTGGDYYNPFMMKLTTDGNYILHAGSMTETGFVDGDKATARLFGPASVIYDAANNNFLVTDASAQALRMIGADGSIKTITGAGGTMQPFKPGYVDGTLDAAYFRNPTHLCIDRKGDIYILDKGNKAIRKVFLK